MRGRTPVTLSLPKHDRQTQCDRPSTGSGRSGLGLPLLLVVLLSLSPVAAEEGQKSTFARAVEAYNQRDLDKALELARQSATQRPHHADTHALLGQLYYLRQDLARAEEHWERALALAPGREDVVKALEQLRKEAGIEKAFARSDTHPFVVRFAEQQVPVDSLWLRQTLRDCYRQVGQQFEYFPDHPITVLLYGEQDFEKVKGLSHQVGGFYDGKIRLPVRAGQTTGGELKRVLWHEFTHAIVHDLSKGSCPLWLNEGIASLQEARVQPVDIRLAARAFRENRLPGWEQFFGQGYRTSSLQEDYQVAYLIAQYLVKRWSWRDLVGLLRRLGDGASIEEAIRAEYRSGLKELEGDWRRWLKNRV